MLVELVTFSGYNEVIKAARTCKRSEGSDNDGLMNYLLRHNHLSPFEFLHFKFKISGVSRVLTHQLVRHRIASYCQESQRYVTCEDVVLPDSMVEKVGKEKAKAMMALAFHHYRYLLSEGVPKEDARYVLPQAVTSTLMIDINARSLMNFFNQRCCIKAHWEIRELAERMKDLVTYYFPVIFKYAGPPCEGYRPVCYEARPGEFACMKMKKSEAEPVFVNPEMPEELMAWDFLRK